MADNTQADVPRVSAAPPVDRSRLVVPGLMVATVAMLMVGLVAGRYPIAFDDLMALLWRAATSSADLSQSAEATVLFRVRLPRVCAAVVVGAALSGSGACYQAIFRNPIVDPSLLGVSAGAALGAAAGILLSAGVAGIQALSFALGLAAVAITVTLSWLVSRHGESSLTLVLCGIVTGTLCSACLSLLKYLADPYSKLPAITYWLMGSLASVTLADAGLAALLAAAGTVPLLLLRWRVNVLSFGDDEAKSMGVNTAAVRAVVIAASTLVTAAAVAISGMIGWVGLVVPHLARMLVGPSFAVLLPASLLMGALFLLTVDTVSRVAFPVEVPLGILTAIIGAPFFVYLLVRGRRGWT